jgi:DNA repair protein RecO (recombination protein O)
VSRAAANPWQDRMLRLPAFLMDAQERIEPSLADLEDGFALTGFFLTRHLFAPRGLPLPDARASFIAAVVGAYRDTRAAS